MSTTPDADLGAVLDAEAAEVDQAAPKPPKARKNKKPAPAPGADPTGNPGADQGFVDVVFAGETWQVRPLTARSVAAMRFLSRGQSGYSAHEAVILKLLRKHLSPESEARALLRWVDDEDFNVFNLLVEAASVGTGRPTGPSSP